MTHVKSILILQVPYISSSSFLSYLFTPTSHTMASSLRTFLDTHRVTDSDWNLTGMGKDQGKYNVSDAEYDTFLHLVQSHIFGPKPMASSLLERHREVGPLLIDLDFRYAAGGPLVRRFEDVMIRRFVAEYIAALAMHTEVETFPGEFIRFYMMVKPAPETDKAHHKDGVHIQCPDLHSLPKFQYAIRGYLLQRGAVQSVFGPTHISNPPEDVYDVSVIHRNNWFLYGACKPDKAQYTVHHVWRITPSALGEAVEEANGNMDALVDILVDILDEDVSEDMFSDQTSFDRNGAFLKVLSIRRGIQAANIPPIRAARSAEWEELLVTWGSGKAKPDAPRNTQTNYGGGHAGEEKDSTSMMDRDEMRRLISAYSVEDVALSYRIARQCLNPERRALRYTDWVNLAICLRNIAPTDESFRVWMELSRRVPDYESRMSDADYFNKWNMISRNTDASSKRLGMGSLVFWARDDAPETLKAIQSETNRDWIMNFAKDTHVNVAFFVCRLYGHEFRCSVGAKRTGSEWFQYCGHSWKHLRTPNELRSRLSADVRNNYIEADREFGRRIQQSVGNESEGKMLDEKRKKILQIERQLEMASFKDSVLKECAEKFYDEDFLTRLNCNPYLVGVANGVLELRWIDPADQQMKVHFRPGMPEDYISFQMGRSEPDLDAVHYIPWKSVDVEERDALEGFFERIYPDPTLRRYVLTLLSSCLEGQNREQRFYINQGRGSNGKSMIQTLMRYTFGDYQTSLQTTALTRKRPESGAANPDMIVTKCKRYIYMGEPDQNEKLNTARMKQLSGEDIVEARGLFADQEKFKMMGKIFLSCNDLPPVSSMDDGTWRRIRTIPHIATFVDPGKPTNTEAFIYPKDLQLEHKLRKWRTGFLSMLVEYYSNEYLVNGLQEPDVVKEASNKYKEENDTFHTFFQENFVVEVGTGPLTILEVMDRYKEWKRGQIGRTELKRKEIIDRMRSVADRKSSDREFWGIRILAEDEDAREDRSVASLQCSVLSP